MLGMFWLERCGDAPSSGEVTDSAISAALDRLRRLRRVVALSAVALATSGCGGNQTDYGGPAFADDGSVMIEEYRHLARAGSVETTAELDYNESVPWAVNMIERSSSTLFIAYVDGVASRESCGKHLGVDVVETERSVTIAAVNSPRDSETDCGSDVKISGGSIELAAPLANRVLLHAPLSEYWANAGSPLPTEMITPTPAPSMFPAYDGEATCANLLDARTISDLDARGDIDRSEAAKAGIEGDTQSPLFNFLKYGGLVCAWGPDAEGTPNSVFYAYGPISTEDREVLQLDISTNAADWGYTASESEGLLFFRNESNEGQDDGGFAFGPGFWAFSLDGGGGDVLDQIVKNAPES